MASPTRARSAVDVLWPILALIGAGLGVAGSLTPWATANTIFGSLDKGGLAGGDGIVTLAASLVAACFAVVALVAPRRRWPAGVTAVALLPMAALVSYDTAQVYRLVQSVSGDGFEGTVGVGLYLLGAACLLIFIAVQACLASGGGGGADLVIRIVQSLLVTVALTAAVVVAGVAGTRADTPRDGGSASLKASSSSLGATQTQSAPSQPPSLVSPSPNPVDMPSWSADSVPAPGYLAAVASNWPQADYAGCSLYAFTAPELGDASPSFGGSAGETSFTLGYRNAEITIIPPKFESHAYARFAGAEVTNEPDGTVVRAAYDTDAFDDLLLAIPGDRCFVEMTAADHADWGNAYSSMRRVSTPGAP